MKPMKQISRDNFNSTFQFEFKNNFFPDVHLSVFGKNVFWDGDTYNECIASAQARVIHKRCTAQKITKRRRFSTREKLFFDACEVYIREK